VTSSAVARAFEHRAQRADALAPQSEAGRASLEFAAGLYRVQGAANAAIGTGAPGGRLDPELDGLATLLLPVVQFAAERGPPLLSASARSQMNGDLPSSLRAWWSESSSGRDDYLARAVLRPYVEALAAVRRPPEPRAHFGGCPFCGGPPWIAWRRGGSESEGARRFLGCALCGGEWPVNRISCPACHEENPDKLPSFQSERYPTVRIEACATCHSYLKSLDLTLDAHVVPEVDDLLSLSMDLWAGEQGYTRIEPGLAGV
jgi:formate dehydrogenase maturation protein FdhE